MKTSVNDIKDLNSLNSLWKNNLSDLIKARAEKDSKAIAIVAPGRKPLSYGHLNVFVRKTVEMLNTIGVGRNDRVAIVLPNGPEMAVAFLALSSGATSAPLNPAYRQSEFEFYLSDLNAKALIVQSGIDSSARTAARTHNIPVIELIPALHEEAGIFTLSSDKRSDVRCRGFAQPEDVALVLHTSGTTSRPKLVPLTQANICNSALNTQISLEMDDRDLCLNVMPLFHIHGLIGALLSSIVAGARVFCTQGFTALEFFELLKEYRPTWFTAVPTIHQAILDHAESNRKILSKCPLRFIRSCSAPLPPKMMTALEAVFKTPVIEAYGMTEASHQMASNPLPPLKRKAGSVGVASGPELAIMDKTDKILPLGNIGEIVIRGENVMHGYENNPDANRKAFSIGWFRTGDQGYMDSDNYLFITGRLKEIINRGGEKISPREIDEALMDHPAVFQVVTFAVPHDKLGEDVVTAIVLRENATTTEKEIRELAFARLADYKVPSQVVIVDKIPKGPTGKLQRIGLAKKLASKLKAQYVAPRSSVEELLTRIWIEVLGVEQVGILDNFFALGGDSLLAAQVVSRLDSALNVELPLPIIFRSPTISEQALLVEDKLLGEIEKLSEDEAQRFLK